MSAWLMPKAAAFCAIDLDQAPNTSPKDRSRRKPRSDLEAGESRFSGLVCAGGRGRTCTTALSWSARRPKPFRLRHAQCGHLARPGLPPRFLLRSTTCRIGSDPAGGSFGASENPCPCRSSMRHQMRTPADCAIKPEGHQRQTPRCQTSAERHDPSTTTVQEYIAGLFCDRRSRRRS